MPRPRAPPTPSASTDLKASDRTVVDRDMEGTFSLPPPAVYKKPTPPVSPVVDHRSTTTTPTATAAPSPRHKRTLSGATKSKEDLSAIPQYNLPPPPSRARKIIQMKPKAAPAAAAAAAAAAQAATTSPNSDSSEPSSQQPPATSLPAKSTGNKRKQPQQQPSATSAAGRKIARKTAHSIIERRRRSKMNEEFGVLKDMIPACEGVEMHKLAILQAGIEYVRYLEGCIKQLKGEKEAGEAAQASAAASAAAAAAAAAATEEQEQDNDDDDIEIDNDDDNENDNANHDKDDDEEYDDDQDQEMAPSPAKRTATKAPTEWQYYRSPSLGTMTSPELSLPRYQQQQPLPPQQRPVLPSIPSSFSAPSPALATAPNSSTGSLASTHLSPAFNAIHFSPDLSRGAGPGPGSGSVSALSSSATKPALHLPLPQVPLEDRRDGSKIPSPSNLSQSSGGAGVGAEAEATATAALMMLTKDRRSTLVAADNPRSSGTSGGMSVRDLLSS